MEDQEVVMVVILWEAYVTGNWLYWQFLFFYITFFSSLLSYSTGSEERQRNPKKKERRESGREEGKWELRELIILFNHILDEGQVVCGTESETEKGEWGEEYERVSKWERGWEKEKRREMEEQMERKGEREDGKGTYGERGWAWEQRPLKQLEVQQCLGKCAHMPAHSMSMCVFVCKREWQPFP